MAKETKDLINFSTLSELLTGRPDVIRANRVQKKHKKKIDELITLLDYWKSKIVQNG